MLVSKYFRINGEGAELYVAKQSARAYGRTQVEIFKVLDFNNVELRGEHATFGYRYMYQESDMNTEVVKTKFISVMEVRQKYSWAV